MIILDNLNTNEIKFIARDGTPTQVELVDEQTKEETVLTPTFTTDGYYTVFTLVHDVISNRRYKLTVSDSNNKAMYRDLIFITMQETEAYTVYNNEYDAHSTITDVDNTTNPKYKII